MRLSKILGCILRIPKLDNHDFIVVKKYYPGVEHIRCCNCDRNYVRHTDKNGEQEFFRWGARFFLSDTNSC